MLLQPTLLRPTHQLPQSICFVTVTLIPPVPAETLTVAGSMSDAQAVLMGMSSECAPVASDKVDFTVTYGDGHEYTGTYSLADLAEHMLANLRTSAQIGLDAAALAFVQSIDRDGSRRRAALEFLATREVG